MKVRIWHSLSAPSAWLTPSASSLSPAIAICKR
jgi:hypothetical protein